MCAWGTEKIIHVIRRNNDTIPDGWHPMVVDACIASYVQRMNDLGIITVGCCCGHGQYAATVHIAPESRERAAALGYDSEPYETGSFTHTIRSRNNAD